MFRTGLHSLTKALCFGESAVNFYVNLGITWDSTDEISELFDCLQFYPRRRLVKYFCLIQAQKGGQPLPNTISITTRFFLCRKQGQYHQKRNQESWWSSLCYGLFVGQPTPKVEHAAIKIEAGVNIVFVIEVLASLLQHYAKRYCKKRWS